MYYNSIRFNQGGKEETAKLKNFLFFDWALPLRVD